MPSEFPCQSTTAGDLWFSSNAREQRIAADLCLDCPLPQYNQCREEGWSHEFGVWGGLTAANREQLDHGRYLASVRMSRHESSARDAVIREDRARREAGDVEDLAPPAPQTEAEIERRHQDYLARREVILAAQRNRRLAKPDLWANRLARRRARHAKERADLLANAERHGTTWSNDELALAWNRGLTAREVARRTGRTVGAVKAVRMRSSCE
jgi:hypothetical protein